MGATSTQRSTPAHLAKDAKGRVVSTTTRRDASLMRIPRKGCASLECNVPGRTVCTRTPKDGSPLQALSLKFATFAMAMGTLLRNVLGILRVGATTARLPCAQQHKGTSRH